MKRFDQFVIFLFCSPLLLSPLGKITPLPAAYIDSLIYVLMLFGTFWALYRCKGLPRIDGWIYFTLLVYLVCSLAALLLSIQYGIVYVLSSILSRLVPVGCVIIAGCAYNPIHIFRRTILYYLIAAAIMLPFAAIGIGLGPGSLPELMRMSQGMIDAGKEVRFGIAAFAGIFNSPLVLAWAYWALAAMCVYLLERKVLAKRDTVLIYLGLIVCFCMIILSGKRLPLLLAFVPLSYILLIGPIQRKLKLILGMVAGGTVFAVIIVWLLLTGRIGTEAQAGFVEYFAQITGEYVVFILDLVVERLEHFGSRHLIGEGLGASGSEARYFAPRLWYSHLIAPEMGVALLIIEYGVIGCAILVPVLCIAALRVVVLGLKRSPGLSLFVLLYFLSFVFKELNIMIGPYFSICFFWFALGTVTKKDIHVAQRMV